VWRWRNVPVPESHLAGLVLGILIQLVIPVKLLPIEWLSRTLGLMFLVGGVLLAAWAVKAVGEIDAAKPERLVAVGPYAYSRNPMYVASDAIYLGITLVANALWPLLLFPAVLLWNHVQVLHEERNLARQFGTEYREYRRKIRRYL
jgi:protein-S-isoprenylcysteine O-methyltransferase Ste14